MNISLVTSFFTDDSFSIYFKFFLCACRKRRAGKEPRSMSPHHRRDIVRIIFFFYQNSCIKYNTDVLLTSTDLLTL
jgi:hypothetical protein